eukprot:6202612-Pleurochrysis_carterae.AAC.2
MSPSASPRSIGCSGSPHCTLQMRSRHCGSTASPAALETALARDMSSRAVAAAFIVSSIDLRVSDACTTLTSAMLSASWRQPRSFSASFSSASTSFSTASGGFVAPDMSRSDEL